MPCCSSARARNPHGIAKGARLVSSALRDMPCCSTARARNPHGIAKGARLVSSALRDIWCVPRYASATHPEGIAARAGRAEPAAAARLPARVPEVGGVHARVRQRARHDLKCDDAMAQRRIVLRPLAWPGCTLRHVRSWPDAAAQHRSRDETLTWPRALSTMRHHALVQWPHVVQTCCLAPGTQSRMSPDAAQPVPCWLRRACHKC